MSREQRPVVITGASRGFGAALARHVAGLGHDVAICARGSGGLAVLASQLREEFGTAAVAVSLDVTDEAAVREFAAQVASDLGPCCGVLNNAGILGPVGAVDQLDLGAWRHTLDVNLVGTLLVTAAFVPQLAQGGGAIVNVSGAGIGGPGLLGTVSAYTTSKGAVVTLTEALSIELRKRHIRVNAFAPGVLKTGFMNAALDAAPETVDEELLAVASAVGSSGDQTPINLDANQAELISFLISNESAWLTGKLVSARWDTVTSLKARREHLVGTSLLNLRRIDGTLFDEAK